MNFQNQLDYLPTMFDDINLPEELSHELVVSSIVKRCGLLTPVYSEPYLMKDAIDLWFNANQWTLQHLIKIIEAEYSPIENTDRYDEQTRTIDRELDRDDTFNETNTLAKTGTETTKIDSDTTVDADNEKTEQVAPYDSNTWHDSSKSIEDNGSTATVDGTNRVTYNTTDTTSHGGTNGRDEDENTTDHFVQHLHGNIGVTSNQDMLSQEIALLEKFHVYDWIALQIEADLFIILY